MHSAPRSLIHPCNCFGTFSRFEGDMEMHEMEVTPGCVRKIQDHLKMASRYNVREFGTGATRDRDGGKPDYDGYFSPLVIHAYGLHMMKHQKDPAGGMRESDNWQLGIPKEAYIKSGWRHFIDVWCNHRGYKFIRKEKIITAICALLFNVMGYLHEYLKDNPEALKDFEKECGYGE